MHAVIVARKHKTGQALSHLTFNILIEVSKVDICIFRRFFFTFERNPVFQDLWWLRKKTASVEEVFPEPVHAVNVHLPTLLTKVLRTWKFHFQMYNSMLFQQFYWDCGNIHIPHRGSPEKTNRKRVNVFPNSILWTQFSVIPHFWIPCSTSINNHFSCALNS